MQTRRGRGSKKFKNVEDVMYGSSLTPVTSLSPIAVCTTYPAVLRTCYTHESFILPNIENKTSGVLNRNQILRIVIILTMITKGCHFLTIFIFGPVSLKIWRPLQSGSECRPHVLVHKSMCFSLNRATFDVLLHCALLLYCAFGKRNQSTLKAQQNEPQSR